MPEKPKSKYKRLVSDNVCEEFISACTIFKTNVETNKDDIKAVSFAVNNMRSVVDLLETLVPLYLAAKENRNDSAYDDAEKEVMTDRLTMITKALGITLTV